MNRWIGGFKVFGYTVVVLMAGAMGYAAYTSLAYWSGIGV